MKNSFSRRLFLTAAAGTLAIGCATPSSMKTRRRTVSLKRSGYVSPNEKLNVAGVGVGGKGRSDIGNCDTENIVALCDVDWRRASGSFKRFPDAKKYKDFRKMLDEVKEIDAVTVSTADHTHAVIALRCMEQGKHVYVQKPLTHTVNEARVLRQKAQEYNVATQMGNQGNGGDPVRYICEMVWDGKIGEVNEVHAWTNRPIWPQGIPNALPPQEVPDDLNWEMWLGPAPYRPYNEDYVPFKWRGWWDYGTGALGDMGCHIFNPCNRALRLYAPISVECTHVKDLNDQTYPTESIIKYQFPAREAFPPLTVYWYDGNLKPPKPEGVASDVDPSKQQSGSFFVGDKGILSMETHGDNPMYILDGKLVNDYEAPMPLIPRIPKLPNDGGKDRQQKLDWIHACKGGPPAGSNFDYSGPLTEWVLLGNIALKFPNQELRWDSERMRFTNNQEANKWIEWPHREPYELLA